MMWGCVHCHFFFCVTLGGFSNSLHRAIAFLYSCFQVHLPDKDIQYWSMFASKSSTRKVLEMNIFSFHTTAQDALWVASEEQLLFWDKLLAIVGKKEGAVTLPSLWNFGLPKKKKRNKTDKKDNLTRQVYFLLLLILHLHYLRVVVKALLMTGCG